MRSAPASPSSPQFWEMDLTRPADEDEDLAIEHAEGYAQPHSGPRSAIYVVCDRSPARKSSTGPPDTSTGVDTLANALGGLGRLLVLPNTDDFPAGACECLIRLAIAF